MIYLDNAATTSPKPESVCIAVEQSIRDSYGNPGRSTNSRTKQEDTIYETRELIIKLVNGSDPNQVIFTSCATDSLNLAIKGFLKKGDHVITSSVEHNSVIRPLKHLELDGTIELSVIEADKLGYINPEDIRLSIKKNTKLIVTTHASNVIGTIVPIEKIGAIAAENKIRYLVDGSQTIGFADIDVKKMNIDMLAFPGHKNLFGPSGTGGLYIKKGIDLTPLRYGGTGNLSETLTQPNKLPYKYESGTPNFIGISGLNAGVKFILDQGLEKIREHERKLTKMMLEQFRKNSSIDIYSTDKIENKTPIIPINIRNYNPAEVGYDLTNIFDIITRTGLQCSPLSHKTIGTENNGTVRFSIGYFNTEEEIAYTIDALKKICETL